MKSSKFISNLSAVAPLLPVFLLVTYVGIGIARLFGTASVFPHSLNEPPLFWWPVAFWPALVILLLWALICFLTIGRINWSQKAGLWILALSILLFIAGISLNTLGGVAIYPDRIVMRDLNRFTIKTETLWLKDIRTVTLSCDAPIRDRRGPDKRLPAWFDYRVTFANGRSLDLTDGAEKAQDYARWLRTVTSIDGRLSQSGVPRRLSDDQTSDEYAHCAQRSTQSLTPRDRDNLLNLFSPDEPK